MGQGERETVVPEYLYAPVKYFERIKEIKPSDYHNNFPISRSLSINQLLYLVYSI